MDKVEYREWNTDIVIQASDIILLPFQVNYKENFRKKTEGNIEEEKKVEASLDDWDYLYRSWRNSNKDLSRRQLENISGYLSTPRFIKYLCDISVDILNEPNKKEILKHKLWMLNNYLPAAVYIPFVNKSMRNYAVLHITATECRVFQTKEWAPYLISLEVYWPEEI